LANRLSHFGQVQRQVINLGNRAYDAIRLITDAAKLVIEQALHNVRSNLQFSELRAKRAAQVMERPSGHATALIKLDLGLLKAVKRSRRLSSHVSAGGGK